MRGLWDLRNLPPWRQAVYWLVSIRALALVIWDIVGPSAVHGIVVVVLGLIATVALRGSNRESVQESSKTGQVRRRRRRYLTSTAAPPCSGSVAPSYRS